MCPGGAVLFFGVKTGNIFIIIPFVELATFASVSEHIGIWTTLCLAFLTAIIGGGIVKYQGLHTIVSMREAMDRGQMPLTEIFDGFCLVAAGALLITPGFVTDTIGFALLIPLVRSAIRTIIKERTTWFVSSSNSSYGHYNDKNARDPNIIEGEFQEIDDSK